MTTANSAHSEQQEIRDGSRIFFTYILGLLASVTDGSQPYVISLNCQHMFKLGDRQEGLCTDLNEETLAADNGQEQSSEKAVQ